MVSYSGLEGLVVTVVVDTVFSLEISYPKVHYLSGWGNNSGLPRLPGLQHDAQESSLTK